MQRIVFYGLFLIVIVATGACSPAKKTETGETSSDLEKIAKGEMISGEELMPDYVELLCDKYDDCGIKAFTDAQDCQNRIKTVLTADSKWQGLNLDKRALQTCLKDFKGFACDAFKEGKNPESCAKL